MDEIDWFLFAMCGKKILRSDHFCCHFLPDTIFVGIFPKDISRIILFVFSVSFRILAYWDSNKNAGTSLSFPYPARCPIQANRGYNSRRGGEGGWSRAKWGFPKEHCLFHKTMALGGKIPTLKLGSWQVCCYGFCPEKMGEISRNGPPER